MKFKGSISKIDEGGARAITDNPLGEKPCYSDFDHYDHDYGGNIQSPDESVEYASALEAWKEAEAQRKEYKISPYQLFKIDNGYVPLKGGEEISVGDRIEGEIINNEIVNVKIVQ